MSLKHRIGDSPACGCFDEVRTRRDFLSRASCALVAALAASGVSMGDAAAISVTLTQPVKVQGTERQYAVPTADGVQIDMDNQVILARRAEHIYAFSLACPHESALLRWRPEDQRFQCPRHESKYQPDGTFISGRATRNMDRFAIGYDGKKLFVDLAKLYRSDEQESLWESAFVKI